MCENKYADMLRANLRLCIRYIASTIPILSKSKISSLLPSPVTVQPGFCWKPRRSISSEYDEAHFVSDRTTYLQQKRTLSAHVHILRT